MTKRPDCPRFHHQPRRSGVASGSGAALLGRGGSIALCAVRAVFGRAVARQIINGLCRPPFEMPVLFSIGTKTRLRSLLDLVESAGRFVPSQGFFGAGDDYRMIEVVPPAIPAGLVDLPHVDLPRPLLSRSPAGPRRN